MRGKRAQFFILAAVILSSVVVSLTITRNYVNINKEQAKFYDLGSEIKQESLSVIDYGVFSSDEKLYDFTNKSIRNLRDNDPEMELVVMYGNKTNISVENYAKEIADIGGMMVPGGGENIESRIDLNVGGIVVGQDVLNERILFTKDWKISMIPSTEIIIVKIDENEYEFELAGNQQFYLIAKKTFGREDYVAIK